MSARSVIGLVLIALGSLVIGWYFGRWGYSLFEQTVPAGAVTELVRSGTKGAYFFGGIILSLVIFGWSVLVAYSSRFFRASSTSAGSAAPARAASAAK